MVYEDDFSQHTRIIGLWTYLQVQYTPKYLR